MIKRTLVALGILISLSACQTLPAATSNDGKPLLVAPTFFSGQIWPIESPEQIYALPEHTKAELLSLQNNKLDISSRSKAMIRHIFSYASDDLLYDSSATRTVSETLTAGKANCLSLSILAYSMAKELGLDAVFQDVDIPEYWTSELNTTWLNGHVNVRLRQSSTPQKQSGTILLGHDVVIDFDPQILRQHFKTKVITKDRATAMFYNNKAAEQQNLQHYAQAYQYYQAAIAADPEFAVTWANLAVLYRQHGLLELAEQLYRHSLVLAPDSMNAMANLAILYQLTGRENLAAPLLQQVSKVRLANPYYYVMLGNEALRRQDTTEAINQFQQALKLDRKNHEAYFSLAKSYYLSGNTVQAQRYLQQAIRTSVAQDKARYQRKLTALLQ
ncbi:tetratricopeptide repeat protein [Rheinheimera fenheensis]|uniref:tetratricopeptide repeat protein n=1 Tax=Rheinheimera fenheensis TaxID=3152295 RepID=UPI00325C925C